MHPRELMRSDWSIYAPGTDGQRLTIRDNNIGRMSVTNDIENVVDHLIYQRLLRDGMQFFYYDSDNELTEVLWDKKGFIDFKFVGD